MSWEDVKCEICQQRATCFLACFHCVKQSMEEHFDKLPKENQESICQRILEARKKIVELCQD